MRLVAGDRAKPFTMLDAFGHPIRLEDYAGQNLLLCFYRYSTCAMCNLHLHRLVEWSKALAGELKMIAVFESPAENILNNHPVHYSRPATCHELWHWTRVGRRALRNFYQAGTTLPSAPFQLAVITHCRRGNITTNRACGVQDCCSGLNFKGDVVDGYFK